MSEGAARPRLPDVDVSVQWRGAVPGDGTRHERKQHLTEVLHSALRPHHGLSIDWDSVSLSAQTVDARIDADHADETIAALTREGFRVDLLIDRPAAL